MPLCVDGLVQSPVVNERRFNMFHHKVNPSSPHIVFFYSAAKIAREECYFLQYSQIREICSRRMSSIAHVAVDVVDVKGRR